MLGIVLRVSAVFYPTRQREYRLERIYQSFGSFSFLLCHFLCQLPDSDSPNTIQRAYRTFYSAKPCAYSCRFHRITLLAQHACISASCASPLLPSSPIYLLYKRHYQYDFMVGLSVAIRMSLRWSATELARGKQ